MTVRPTVLGRPVASAVGVVLDAVPLAPPWAPGGSPRPRGRVLHRDTGRRARPVPALVRLRRIGAGLLVFAVSAVLVLGLGLIADAVAASRAAGPVVAPPPVTAPLDPGTGTTPDAVLGGPPRG